MTRVLLVLVLLLGAAAAPPAAAGSAAVLAVTDVRMSLGDDPAWAATDFDDSTWARAAPWAVNPKDRLLWMRARVDAPAGVLAGEMPLLVHATMAGSWEAYWNGHSIGRNGVPGSDAVAESPGRISAAVLVPADLVRASGNVLALRVSSQHLTADLAAPIQYIGVEAFDGTRPVRLERALPFLAAGPLLLGALYFAVMFVLDRRDVSSLLLALLALAVLGQLVAESVRAFVSYPYPLHVMRLRAILLFAALTSTLLAAFVAHRYARRHVAAASLLTLVAVAAAAALVDGYDGKTSLILLAGLLVAIACALAGLFRRVRGAGATALGVGAVLLMMVLDVVRFLDLGYYVSATVLLLFLFAAQAVELRRSQRAGSAAQLRAVQLELELLKQRIQPHALMNTLTALAEWVESSPRTGVKMIDALATEFRLIAAMSGRALVPLREELDLCRQHLALMSFRMDRRYELRDSGVDPEALLPPAVLHTLLENALTHNRYANGATFTLEVSRQAECIVYRLRSPREGPLAGSRGGGTGHDYVRGRLRAAYGEAAEFSSRAASLEAWEDRVAVPSRDPR